MPVREIPIQTRSKSGYFHSVKNGRSVAYESLLEKKIFLLLEFDENVTSYEEQPLKVGGYIPDVLAKRDGFPPLLIEVKYSREAGSPDERLQKKISELEKFCAEKGWEFKMFTEKEIKEPYFGNISFLYRYIRTTVVQEKGILDFVEKRNETTLSELFGSFDPQEIYALLAKRRLSVDLHGELSASCKVRISDV